MLKVYGDRRCKCGRGMTSEYADGHFGKCKVCFMKLKRKVKKNLEDANKEKKNDVVEVISGIVEKEKFKTIYFKAPKGWRISGYETPILDVPTFKLGIEIRRWKK